jgi:diaminohydroxyphosphoribosylaminopyrimidine deaminase / 5-amino-6-(5-phosphoribosylamino)uracil reductase
MFTAEDRLHMTRALELAALGLHSTSPNPRVGCVIVRDRQVVGEGWHHHAGGPHAEIVALAQAGGAARGATLYLSLEPCSHHGRTPPCVDALIEARIGRVVVAMEDPNPLVNGRGLATLRAAGIDVRCGLLEAEARELNIGFVARMVRGTPWTRMKIAASLDGRTALPDGRSQWITGQAARDDGHAWRARACAILTGIGTVRDDDPQLNVRALETSRQPLRVLVDSKLELDPAARIVGDGRLLVACACELPGKAAALRDRGVELLELDNGKGKVDLSALLKELGRRGISELHVEAGSRLNGSLLAAGCVDELLVYLAPVMLGNSVGMADLLAPIALDQAMRLSVSAVDRVGSDIRLLARLDGREPWAVVSGGATAQARLA